MKQAKQKGGLLKNSAVQAFVSSLLCIVIGLLVGYVVLLFINPRGAGKAMLTVIKNFLYYPSGVTAMKYLGSTLVKTAPLLLCSLSVLFAYKAGLFNIGAAGQYVLGAGASLYCALAFGWPWYLCLLAAVLAGAIPGAISGALKAYCNVNEVISGIMLNWIGLYSVNMLLTLVKEGTSPYTAPIQGTNPSAIMPSMGLGALFSNNQYVTIGVPLSALIAVGVWVVLEKTRFGYELKATGYNKNAAKYSGMKEKRNLILTMAISGALAGTAAALLFLSGFEQWQCTATSVPAMGFNGIAAAFLGGLHPVGAIFSSYFIQHITNGGAYVDKTMYCAQISDLISSLIIYLCGFVLFFRQAMTRAATRKEERAALAAKEGAGEGPEAGKEAAPAPEGASAPAEAGPPAGKLTGEGPEAGKEAAPAPEGASEPCPPGNGGKGIDGGALPPGQSAPQPGGGADGDAPPPPMGQNGEGGEAL